jgi:ABC-type transporter Mla MlaB component
MTDAIGHTVALSGDLGIRNVAELLTQLRTALSEHRSITLDCSGLTGADIATVQMLVAARKTAAAEGRALQLRYPPGVPLAALLTQIGFLTTAGAPKTPHDGFWTGRQGIAA